jgi:divalent metal cation (Fe/Co/Zn/Cd) transporter
MLNVRSPRFYPLLSVAAALVTMAVKFIGYFLTGSVGLFWSHAKPDEVRTQWAGT